LPPKERLECRGGGGRSRDDPVLTIADLGVLRDVAVNDGMSRSRLRRPIPACPAMT